MLFRTCALLLLIAAMSAGGCLLSAQEWVVPAAAAATANAVPSSTGAVSDGKGVYVSYCLSCHGDEGKGDGAAGKYFIPKPSDLTTSGIATQSDGALFWKITTGRNSMAPFKGPLTEPQRWKVILYLRTLQPKAAAGAVDSPKSPVAK
jgi:mono/diheme cytochrome c family protein